VTFQFYPADLGRIKTLIALRRKKYRNAFAGIFPEKHKETQYISAQELQ